MVNMKDNLIFLYEIYETAKSILDALKVKYGPMSDTDIQIFLYKYFSMQMNESTKVLDHAHQMKLIAKGLSNFSYSLSNKMQMTTIFNNLPNS